MISPSLENLVDTGQLKREPGDQKEFDGLVRSGRARLSDAITVFLCLPHTLGLEPAIWRLLVHCHGLRNRGEYEGLLDVDDQLVAELLKTAQKVLESVEMLEPAP